MQTLIFLNGTIPGQKVINEFQKRKNFVIAADGGANHLRKIKLIPDLIIGDLDSISKDTITFFRKKGSVIKKIEDQDKTDFEKCLLYSLQKKNKRITVFGFTGSRPDHSLNNLSIVKRYYRKADIKLVSDDFEAYYIKKKTDFNYRTGEIISLMAMPVAKNIYTKGLEYILNDEDLEFGIREGSLNRSVSDKISVRFKSGDLLIFKKHFYNK